VVLAVGESYLSNDNMTMYKNVTLRLYAEDEPRVFPMVEITVEDGLYHVEGKDSSHFFCHLDDLAFVDEKPIVIDDKVKSLVKAAYGVNGKIPAIKEFRALTGAGLKESKEQVDIWEVEWGFK
jgi:hypothetical protein